MSRLALAAALLSAVHAFGEGIYKVAVDPSRPYELAASLEFSAPAPQLRKLVVRGIAWGLESQVSAPRCGLAPLAPDGNSAWTVPATCREVSWTIVPTKVSDGTVDVSKQASLYFEQGWWLVSEPTSLLRVEGDDTASKLTIGRNAGFGATALGDGIWRLPSTNDAPEFFVLGNAAARPRTIDGFHVVHVADAADRVERLGLLKAHEAALGYLSTIIPTTAVSPNERALLIIWIGIDERHGHAGGAAGHRSFVANYVFGAPENERLNAARTLLVLAHEQFHQLVGLARGSLPAFPVWLNESLAEYYGLKALAAVPNNEARVIYAHFVDPARPVQRGLLELERRYASGDRAAYRLFYEQGATFWAEIDNALRASTGPSRGLDLLMPVLLRGTAADDGGLPSAFVEKLRQALGASADQIIAKYVGR